MTIICAAWIFVVGLHMSFTHKKEDLEGFVQWFGLIIAIIATFIGVHYVN
jgi:hypothetical protein